MDEKLKSISCFDMWVLFVVIFLSFGKLGTPNNDTSAAGTLSLITGGMLFISAIVFLIFCSRLKKYRYLLIYDNCKKVTPTLKNSFLVLLIITGIFIVYTEFEFIKSSIIYISVAVLLSYKHIDSEDKI